MRSEEDHPEGPTVCGDGGRYTSVYQTGYPPRLLQESLGQEDGIG